MRIAQVAPLYVSVPPDSYGGAERIVSLLTEELVRQGHEVTLFATSDSHTSARLIPGAPRSLGFSHPLESDAAHIAMLANVYNQASDFDVIHSHLASLTAPFAVGHATPTLITIHMDLDIPVYMDVLSAFPQLRYISVSESQREPLPDLNWAATVHHGLAIHDYPVSYEPGAYLFFIGRMAPEKGPDRAIAIARRCGIPLKIAGKIDSKDRAFYERNLKPLLDDPIVEFVGPVDERKKRALMRGALALLAPIRCAEPFGLVYVEALACGTPVLTCPYGSAPELLRDGVTGFLRESDDELAEAARHVDELSRASCRAWAMQRFDVSLMTQRYLAAYQAALADRQPRHMVEIPVDPHRDGIDVSPRLLTEEQPAQQ